MAVFAWLRPPLKQRAKHTGSQLKLANGDSIALQPIGFCNEFNLFNLSAGEIILIHIKASR